MRIVEPNIKSKYEVCGSHRSGNTFPQNFVLALKEVFIVCIKFGSPLYLFLFNSQY